MGIAASHYKTVSSEHHHQNGEEDEYYDDECKSLQRMNSLYDIENEQHPLPSLESSIRLIWRRDSNRALMNEEAATRKSPWMQMKSPPMISSPHHYLTTSTPGFQQRRKDLLKKLQRDNRAARKHKQSQQQQQRQQNQHQRGTISRARSGSLGQLDDVTSGGVADSSSSQKEELIAVLNEDDQWERKRQEKLRKVIEKSTSGNSIGAHSTGSYVSSGSNSTSREIILALKEEFAKSSNPVSVSIMYGLINAVIVLPVIMSFGNIIYQDGFFRPYLPILVKLTLCSGVVHQLCFSLFSTLPFAVGSVQDAGLIFLSTIATGMVKYCQDRGCTNEEILATVLVGLPLFTSILGVGLIIIGYLKLAGYVQKLPTTVVGGYLAFIGFFCGQSALSMLSHVNVSGVLEWYKFMHPQPLLLMFPGVAGGAGIFIAVRNLRHMATLPLSIALLLSLFYLTLYVTGTSRDEAKELGWMSAADAPPVW